MNRRYRRGGEPAPVSRSLDEIRAELGLADPGALELLRRRWAECVGDVLAARSHPVEVRDGVLRVRADDAVAATELRYRSSEVQAWALAVAPGCGVEKVSVSMARDRGVDDV